VRNYITGMNMLLKEKEKIKFCERMINQLRWKK